MKKEDLIKLLNDMSLDEKIGQLVQISADSFEGDPVVTGPISELKLSPEQLALAGSVIGSTGATELREIQDKYMERHPHHIPLLFMADVINGFRTAFPIPLAQGCSFDPDLSKRLARAAALEASAAGLHVTFSPMVDLVRDPRWGRVMESTGEDAYLNGLFAEAMVKGYQGDDLIENGRLASCVKHFAAYGAPTAGRDYNNVELSEPTLREDYLPAYQKAIEAGCELVMPSFNTINRIPATANKWLLQEVLRKEMGFEGVVISDWAAIEELIYHGVAKDRSEAAKQAFEAGVDIDMMTSSYAENISDLVEHGEISMEMLDEAVLRILVLKNKLGLFETPYRNASAESEKRWILCEEHRKLAKKAAEESFVLLKNQNMLPLKGEESIAFVGPYMESKWIYGAWSVFAKEEDMVSIKEGVCRKKGNHTDLCFVKGAEILDAGQVVADFARKSVGSRSAEYRKQQLDEAVKAAMEHDKVVLAIGEHPGQSGEAASRTELGISKGQMELLQKVYAVNQRTVVVLFTGRPLDLREIEQYAEAILVVWLPGSEGGTAIADMLYGDAVPSGKLAMSFPYSVGQVPVFYNQFPTGRPAALTAEDSRFGSKYLDIPNQPLYSFGYGLSYTEFKYAQVQLDRTSMTKGEAITVQTTVQNTGEYAAWETVQLYLNDSCARVTRPVKELKGIQRIFLKPNECMTVTFKITEEMLRYYDQNMEYVSETGEFKVYIGSSSMVEDYARFELVE